jgi:hypothetical protein
MTPRVDLGAIFSLEVSAESFLSSARLIRVINCENNSNWPAELFLILNFCSGANACYVNIPELITQIEASGDLHKIRSGHRHQCEEAVEVADHTVTAGLDLRRSHRHADSGVAPTRSSCLCTYANP